MALAREMKMRTLVMILGCLAVCATSSAAGAQNTFKTWKSHLATCGVRRVGSEVRRFIATETSHGLAYDFAPSEDDWRFYDCARDPNAPERVPTLAELLAKIDEKPDCAKQQASWAKMSAAQRREIRAINARIGGPDQCELKP
jgi:hypothetical protein